MHLNKVSVSVRIIDIYALEHIHNDLNYGPIFGLMIHIRVDLYQQNYCQK